MSYFRPISSSDCVLARGLVCFLYVQVRQLQAIAVLIQHVGNVVKVVGSGIICSSMTKDVFLSRVDPRFEQESHGFHIVSANSLGMNKADCAGFHVTGDLDIPVGNPGQV